MPGGTGAAYLTEEARLEAQRRMLAEKFGLVDEDSSSGGEEAAPAAAKDEGRGGAPPAKAAKPARAADGAGAALWPGYVLDVPTSPAGLPAAYSYASAENRAASARRECRFTQITKVDSPYQELHSRKVAVDARLICYSVGSHIRVLARGSTQRALLKGHAAGIRDMAFAAVAVPQDEAAAGEHSAVLGSVAEDGSVFVWKLRRVEGEDEDDGDDVEDAGAGALPVVEKADCVRLEHPVPGGAYCKVVFRPNEGAVLSKSGLGVSLLLVDPASGDLRVSEFVKIGDRSKVLDRVLQGGHSSTAGTGLSDAVWLSKEAIATARGPEVCMWSVKDPKNMHCTGKLGRTEGSPVESMHVLDRVLHAIVLLVVADCGRTLELWSIMDERPLFVQKVEVDAGVESFNTVCHHDQAGEFVVLSSLRGNFLLVFHYRRDRAVFDAVTQIPVKNAVMSLCSTTNTRQVVQDDDRGLPQSSTVEDLGLWCVQPNSIQMIHVPADSCKPQIVNKSATLKMAETPATAATPAVNGNKTVTPSSVPGPVVAKSDTAPSDATTSTKPEAPVEQSTSNTTRASDEPSSEGASDRKVKNAAAGSDTPAPKAAPPKAMKLLLKKKPAPPAETAPAATVPAGPVGATVAEPVEDGVSPSKAGVVAARSAQWEAKTNGPPDTPETTPTKNNRAAESDVAVSKPPPGTQASATKVKATMSAADADELVAMVSAVAKKVAADFDSAGVKSAKADMAKIEGQAAAFRETALESMNSVVAGSLHKPLFQCVVPAISQVVSSHVANVESSASASAGASRASAVESSSEFFAESFKTANIVPSFEKSCIEMGNQASAAVKLSMSSRHEQLVAPSVKAVEDASKELKSATSKFVGTVASAYEDALARGGRAAPLPKTARERVDEFVAAGKLLEAFDEALKEKDADLVVDLCSQQDVCSFFDTYTLSQASTLALAEQLSVRLEVETNTKVAWLEEVMLVLEPADASIAASSRAVLQKAHERIEALRADKDAMKDSPGLLRKLKMLSRLVGTQD